MRVLHREIATSLCVGFDWLNGGGIKKFQEGWQAAPIFRRRREEEPLSRFSRLPRYRYFRTIPGE